MTDQHPAFKASALCQDCGLCCSGALFSHTDVSKSEVPVMQKHGVEIDVDKKGQHSVAFPCPKLEGTKCTIYNDRPRICRTYICTLNRQVLNEEVSLDLARNKVRDYKSLTEQLKQHDLYKAHEAKKPKLPKTEAGVLASWTTAKDLKIVNKGAWATLNDIANMLTKEAKNRALNPDEVKFCLTAFDFATLMDRYFERTSLLRKFASLIQNNA